MNREAWLTELARAHLWPLLKNCGATIPAHWRVSVGFPKGSRGGKSGHAIGQCWPTAASADQHAEMFISPELEAMPAAATLLHELIHAATPGARHGGQFKKLALAAGLTGRMTATVAGPLLVPKLEEMLRAMPPYPHGVLRVPAGQRVGPGSRLLKVSCSGCDYTIRAARSWLEVAVPACPNPDCNEHGECMTVQS